jgi:uncharacterized protein YjbJ (UPF0337 family)
MPEDQGMGEKVKGVAKEAAGKVSGDPDKEREGEAQQKKAQKTEEAERTQAEAEQKHREAVGHEAEEKRRQ